jgi:seryl-tRNA synthetase
MLDLALIRNHPDIIHQFNTVEQCVISKADHEDSVRWHEQLIRNTEELV